MNLNVLVKCEVSIHDWHSMMEANGTAERIPIAFIELLDAESSDEAVIAYWKLENHVVVQGALFESAVYTVSLIGAALAYPTRPKWVMIQLLELLFQIVSGESHPDEVRRGFSDLGSRCRNEANKILWTLYRLFHEGEFTRVAREIIEKVDNEPQRLQVRPV